MKNNIKHRVFVASIATETNTFSPLRTDLQDFHDGFYAAPGAHPDTPTLCSAVYPVARRLASKYNWEIIEGTAAWAEPGGIINAQCWQFLHNNLLEELLAAMPIDIVLLGLHGAMIAQDCLDCEGELLENIRKIVGDEVVVAATLDPHSHLSQRRTQNANLLIAFKEFPHTDFVETAEKLCDLAARAAKREIRPITSVFDCRMITLLPTSHEPMRGFVNRIRKYENNGSILSVSIIHGFMAGDSPDLGVKVLVLSDGDSKAGDTLAGELGMELFGYRGTTAPNFLSADDAFEQAIASDKNPVVIADVWDNPGGGVAGDSTILLRHAMQRQLPETAFATIWDPIAVRTCFSAGLGTELLLRFGGKMSASAGDPIDANIVVRNLKRNVVQKFGPSLIPLGDCAWIEINGIHVILNSIRSQVFDPDIFTNLGLNPSELRILCVKSTNHFYSAFAKLSNEILYASVDGPYPNDPRTNEYKNLRRTVWPRVENPHVTLR